MVSGKKPKLRVLEKRLSSSYLPMVELHETVHPDPSDSACAERHG